MLKVEGGLKYPFHRLTGQHNGTMVGSPARRNMEGGTVSVKDLFIEAAESAEVDIDRAPG